MVSILEQAIGYVTLFNTDMILGAGLLFVTALLISKKPSDWKYLALPITIMWHVVGITPNFMQYIIVGLFWSFSVMRLDNLGVPLRAIGERVGDLVSKTKQQEANDLADKRAEKSFFSRLEVQKAQKKYYESKTDANTTSNDLGIRIIK